MQALLAPERGSVDILPVFAEGLELQSTCPWVLGHFWQADRHATAHCIVLEGGNERGREREWVEEGEKAFGPVLVAPVPEYHFVQ